MPTKIDIVARNPLAIMLLNAMSARETETKRKLALAKLTEEDRKLLGIK